MAAAEAVREELEADLQALSADLAGWPGASPGVRSESNLHTMRAARRLLAQLLGRYDVS